MPRFPTDTGANRLGSGHRRSFKEENFSEAVGICNDFESQAGSNVFTSANAIESSGRAFDN